MIVANSSSVKVVRSQDKEGSSLPMSLPYSLFPTSVFAGPSWQRIHTLCSPSPALLRVCPPLSAMGMAPALSTTKEELARYWPSVPSTGVVGIQDPLRPEVLEAVRKMPTCWCHRPYVHRRQSRYCPRHLKGMRNVPCSAPSCGAALSMTTIVSSSKNVSVLTPVQLLWVNLVMNTFAISTEEPHEDCLERGPVNRQASLVSRCMSLGIFS